MTTHRCPIDGCPLEATSLGLCPGHMKLVPMPVRAEIYQLVKRHRGGPAHLAAIKRAIASVQATIAGWAKKNAEQDTPSAPVRAVSLPYKDE